MNRYIQYMYSYPHKTAYRPLENVDLRDYVGNLEGEGHSLYLHLPFCESKCGYCNLFSVTGCDRIQMNGYLDAVVRQIRQYREMLPRSTSFEEFTIGGGTPLLLAGEQIARIFEAVGANLPLENGCNVIIETAPNQTDREKAELLKRLGVTRVSMGIQSFDDKELRWLVRNHDSKRAKEAAEILVKTGFACVNFDFIYGLPGQTADSLLGSLRTALSLSPDEIFLYPLYIKHGVRLEREGGKEMLDSDHAYALYQYGSAYLRENGYVQISMRRFVKFPENRQLKFRECGLKSALSLGCGGRSYLGRLHFCTPYRTRRADALKEIERYQRTADFSSVLNGILLSDEELKRRYVIKHLLILPGISKPAYQKAFQADLLEDFPMIRNWIECGWLEESSADADYYNAGHYAGKCIGRDDYGRDDYGRDDGSEDQGGGKKDAGGGYIGLTHAGLGLSDYIGPQLISENIRERMLEWERENA